MGKGNIAFPGGGLMAFCGAEDHDAERGILGQLLCDFLREIDGDAGCLSSGFPGYVQSVSRLSRVRDFISPLHSRVSLSGSVIL